MAFRELMMIDVREILRRWQAKQSARQMEREGVADRATVRRYLAAAQSCGVTPEQELTDEVVGQVAQQVQVRAASDPGEVWQTLTTHKVQVQEWLNASVTLRKVRELLARKNVEVTYPTLRRFAMRELDWHKPQSTVLLTEPPAGQEAQVDFGQMGMIHDVATGRRRKVWALLVTLSCSRYMYVWPCFQQTTAEVIAGLEAAWRFFGGMPRTLIPDNMTSVVVHPDALTPTLGAAFLDYVQQRGIFVDPARVRHPQDKPRVENQVAYVRESLFGGEEFHGLDDVRIRAEHWCAEVAGRRVHGSTRKVPREQYEAHEKPAMLPAPREPYDVPIYTSAKVHPDHHVQVAYGLYSVPTMYLGKEVQVRADRAVVKIYLGGKLIKMHKRVGRGERSTDENDYPAHKAGYAMRSIDAVKRQAWAHGDHVGQYADRLLGGPHPWARMRAAYALNRLVEKYGAARVNAVCQSALSFDVIDVKRIQGMLKRAIQAVEQEGGGKVVQLPLPKFARPVEHFSTRKGGRKS